MVYHSTFTDEEGAQQACGLTIFPLRTSTRGPAAAIETGKEDILDEALTCFRANVLFRKFEVKGSSDKLLVYLTLFISLCLKKLEGCKSDAEGVKVLIMMGLDKFALPGEPGFPLNALFSPARTKDEADLFRSYLKQAREETSSRLLEKCFSPDGSPNKWWLAFSKRKFMNLALTS
ncbi:Actin-related protein Arp2/3 complex subunit ARPC3 [Klebsormidium nitens]|uniref:Actin-related protein 2/3 complex subunit 3 n=1 Tax=Klebsormidium nitens TaxID=105231 RepID=A0A1Y1I285_KLENI|nr:Actin-related protein Arp2/3 complex subunit ARPC3 [Klebsormidium nitens]|eukprot:GAQ82238.1 Actin-related protein Arp2/3 complex subunit ARPC3 [Klebsormidium nitens]